MLHTMWYARRLSEMMRCDARLAVWAIATRNKLDAQDED